MDRKRIKQSGFVLLLFFFGLDIQATPFIFDSRSSVLAVENGATLTFDSPVSDFDGTLRKFPGGIITGEQVTFDKGVFEDEDNELLLRAIFDPVGQLLLNGGALVQAEYGHVLQDVLVGGINNTLSGSPIFSSNVVLENNATNLNVALQSTIDQNIVLNGGTLILDNDLVFCGSSIITGSGTISGSCKVVTGDTSFAWDADLLWINNANLELHSCIELQGSLTFGDMNTLNGHGNVLNLLAESSINVAPGATLFLTDITLKGLGGGGSLNLGDATSTVYMSNVTILLYGDQTTSQGSIYVKGPTTWVMKDFDWLFDNSGTLSVDSVTVWLDRAGAETVGDVIFSDPSLFSSISSGTIKCIADCQEIEGVESRIDLIESEVELLESCCETLDSRVDALESCCEELDSRVDIIESEIDGLESCCEELDSQVDILESCCETLDSRVDELESCCESLDSRVDIIESEIDELESCCESLQSQIEIIESQIEVIITTTTALFPCEIIVTDTLEFTLDMVPSSSETVIFKFDPCFGSCDVKPVLVFDPAVFGNNGQIVLPVGSQMIFSGVGKVLLKDGVEFMMQGTPYCLDPNPPVDPRADWPALIVEECAILTLDFQATATIGGGLSTDPHGPGGAGCVIARKGGGIVLDQESHLVFGSTYADDLFINANVVGFIKTTDPRALITFQKACFDVLFDHQSALSIYEGNVEFNMYQGAYLDNQDNEATGVLKSFAFEEGSLLYVLRSGNNVGQISFAPNFNPDPNFALGSDIPTDFNNTCGEICGGGQVNFKEFAGVATTVGETSYMQGGVIGAGSIIPTTIIYNAQTLFDRFELTADTLIPAGSVLAAGSVVNGITLVAPLTIAVDTVFNRGTQLAAGTTIAAYQVTGSPIPLPYAILIPPASTVPTGTVLSPTSERVNATTQLQENSFNVISPIVNVVDQMSYIVPNAGTSDATILVRLSALDPEFDGRLAALCPPARNGINRDGAVVVLFTGDHDVRYDFSPGSPVLNLIVGFTFDGQQFVISNCDATTRTET